MVQFSYKSERRPPWPGPNSPAANMPERATDTQAMCSTRSSMSRRLAASGACCPTAFHHFLPSAAPSTLGAMMHLLDEMNRELLKTEGRHAHPTAGVIDRQSVKPTESGRVREYDAGKKIKGRKRHIGTDTTRLLVGLEVHSAGVQDRDGAPDVLKAVAARYPML